MNQAFDVINQEKLASDLTELMRMESEIHQQATKPLTETGLSSLRDMIKKWLRKALEIAKEFKPHEFSINTDIGIPPRLHISFSWLFRSDGEEENAK